MNKNSKFEEVVIWLGAIVIFSLLMSMIGLMVKEILCGCGQRGEEMSEDTLVLFLDGVKADVVMKGKFRWGFYTRDGKGEYHWVDIGFIDADNDALAEVGEEKK